MLNELSRSDVQSFIKDNLESDLHTLILRKDKYPEIPMALVVDQIKGHHKAKTKLPSWSTVEGIIYPPLISLEQCSSEQAAEYKFRDHSGTRALDLTGGSGVDAFFLSKKFQSVDVIESNQDLVELASYNLKLLGAENITFINTTAEEFISTTNHKYDLIYIDPARRKEGARVFNWSDLSPNVIEMIDQLFKISERVLIKGSPMVDIKNSVEILRQVHNVDIIAIKNDVKEINFLLQKENNDTIELRASNLLLSGDEEDNFKLNDTIQEEIEFGQIDQYLYEPNNSIMKSGAFNQVALKYNLIKLHPHTHFYTTSIYLPEFSGRRFKVNESLPFSKKELLTACPEGKANITARNFPLTVEEIRKRTGIKDGGDKYLLAFTDINGNLRVAVCDQIFK